jgi:muconolactone delta-isomerase
MLYHIDFRVSYSQAMTQKDLFTIWAEEAGAALNAKSAGIVLDLWKVAGENRVIAIVDVDSPDTLDRILMDLPIMQKNGQNIQVSVTSVRRYEDFAADLKERC